jgi:hypothetical protein
MRLEQRVASVELDENASDGKHVAGKRPTEACERERQVLPTQLLATRFLKKDDTGASHHLT